MPENLVSFIQVLRTHDVRVSPAETLDAVNVAATLGYADRQRLRDGLGMALAKTAEEEAIFLQCFDRFFDRRLADFSDGEQAETNTAAAPLDAAQEESAAAQEESEAAQGEAADSVSALEAAAAESPGLASLMASPRLSSSRTA